MRLFVPLTRDEFDRLRHLARTERRRPQEQAAVLLTRALDAPTPASLPTEAVLGEAMQAGALDTSSLLTEVR